jgi:hypothetical protein
MSMGGEMDSMAFPQMKYQLKGPDVIYKNTMPGPGQPSPNHEPVKFTLTVKNGSRTDYHGKSPSSNPVRIVLMAGFVEVGHSPEAHDTMETDITIPAGQEKDFEVSCSVDNDKLPMMGSVTATATFLPTKETVMKMIPVEPVGNK